MTYTAPRECIPTVYDSVGILRGALNTLHHDRFTYDPVSQSKPNRPGYVPPHLTILEPHQDFVAHLHVVYAGERRLMDANDLRRDWGDVLDAPPEKPPRIHLAKLKIGSDGWKVTHSENNQDVPRSYGDIRDYHRKPLRRLAEVASISHEELHDRADALLSGDGTDYDRKLAGLTLPWTTGANFMTASPTLRT